MKMKLRSIVVPVAIAVFTTTINISNAADLPGEGREVRPARPNWDSFWFGQKIVDIGMERLGYEVAAPATLGPPAAFTSIARGDLMYQVDTIFPNHADLYEKTKDDVLPIGPIMNPGTVQGYLVDKKTAEEYNIRYLEDFQDPKIAALFDQDNDGRADMVGPSVSWTGSAGTAMLHMESLGLEDTVRVVQGDYTALAADAVGRYSAGEPIFIYGWYPNPTTMELLPGRDLVWLQLKDVSLPGNQIEQYKPLSGVEGCANDPCEIGWLPTVYYIAVNKNWADENPAAIEFFSQIEMHLEDRVWQNTKMMQGENREDDIENHAREWIDSHKAEFDSWIEAAISVGSKS